MRRAIVIGGVVVVVGAAAGGTALIAGGSDDASEQRATTATATTKVVRRDLVETETVDGTLGYADARATYGSRSGTLTWAPALGAVVRTGHRIYQVDGQSVFLFDGTVPAYRAMGAGTSGSDVLQVERTLRALGDDPDQDISIDGTWDSGTTAAVRRWQRGVGLDETGRLELGAVVFAPGNRRVTELAVKVGGSVGGGSGGSGATGSGAAASSGSGSAVMTTTSTRRIVTVELATTKQELVDDGTAVRVTMPDDRVVRGRVVKVGRVARVPASASGSGSSDSADPTIKVTIRLRGAVRTQLDQAPVDVQLEKERARDALAVPVTALLAQEGGGFAVEVVDGDSRRVVRVEVGLSTDSMVQVTGDGLKAGMTISNSAV
jgi:peptidoglycan hydrolase-like protein with peptidoglycan-binding domain